MSVDIVIPTHNEEHTLERCVWGVLDHLSDLPFDARITIADNASTDRTPIVAERLAREYADVRVIQVPGKGRGLALKTAWSQSAADVLVYMDVDLSTNLNALLPLIAPLVSGHSDIAIGTRLAPGARVLRGSRREIVSRGYNLLLRATLGVGFGDAQCGFKAIRSDAARWLLPLVQDDSWFFDTELLVLAERAGLRIYQVPVDWVDDPDSRVDLLRTAVDDVAGIARLGWSLARGRVPLVNPGPGRPAAERPLLTQVARFLGIGVASTLAYALVFLTLRTQEGATVSNVAALVTTAFFNTAANRLWTFGVRGRARLVRHHAMGFVVLVAGLAVTTAALWLSGEAGVHGKAAELTVLTGANLLVTLARFSAFRLWVFRSPAPLGRQPLASGAAPVDFAQDQA